MLQQLTELVPIPLHSFHGGCRLYDQESQRSFVKFQSVDNCSRDDDIVALLYIEFPELRNEDSVAIMNKKHFISFRILIEIIHTATFRRAYRNGAIRIDRK